MFKTLVDEGCESIYETAIAELERIADEIEKEKAVAFAEIEKKYENKANRLKDVISVISHEVEIVEEPVVAEEPVVEEVVEAAPIVEEPIVTEEVNY